MQTCPNEGDVPVQPSGATPSTESLEDIIKGRSNFSEEMLMISENEEYRLDEILSEYWCNKEFKGSTEGQTRDEIRACKILDKMHK